MLDFLTLTESKKYSIMSNTIFPHPIAWISTEDNGVVNLAPFSYFAPLSSEPPLVIISIANKEGGGNEPKDTLANILKYKVCTINFAHKELLQNLINSSEDLPLILEIKHVYVNDENIDEKNHIHLENIGRVGM